MNKSHKNINPIRLSVSLPRFVFVPAVGAWKIQAQLQRTDTPRFNTHTATCTWPRYIQYVHPPTTSLVASVASRTWALLFGVTEPTNLTSPRHLPVGVRTQSMMKRYYRCGLIELLNSKIINRWRALTGRSFCFAVVRTRRRNLVRILACNETGIMQLIFRGLDDRSSQVSVGTWMSTQSDNPMLHELQGRILAQWRPNMDLQNVNQVQWLEPIKNSIKRHVTNKLHCKQAQWTVYSCKNLSWLMIIKFICYWPLNRNCAIGTRDHRPSSAESTCKINTHLKQIFSRRNCIKSWSILLILYLQLVIKCQELCLVD